MTACNPQQLTVKDPITVSSPKPSEQITKVSLSEEEAACVESGNKLTFNMFPILYKNQQAQKSFIFSPLSIQYALGMTANGASGGTLDQIVSTLGMGADINKLNSLCNKLLNQLPAVDLGVKLQLADAILVNNLYPLSPSFKQQVESTFYGAVENMSFDDPSLVATRINEWASRNTNGLIDKMLDAGDISPAAIAFLMNALYFKAPWVPEGAEPLFMEDQTSNQAFFPGGCDVIEVPTMHTTRNLNYVDLKDFRVLEIPYASGKFAMYILLPEGEVVGDQPDDDIPPVYSFGSLLRDFPSLDWKDILSRMKERQVVLSLPKFETSSSYYLNDTLKELGMTQAFTSQAQFDRMFADSSVQALIDMVIQKARIKVAEWGTEAAAVTVVGMKNSAFFDPDTPVEFKCNHPFAYIIAEKTSGAILFAGAYLGNP